MCAFISKNHSPQMVSCQKSSSCGDSLSSSHLRRCRNKHHQQHQGKGKGNATRELFVGTAGRRKLTAELRQNMLRGWLRVGLVVYNWIGFDWPLAFLWPFGHPRANSQLVLSDKGNECAGVLAECPLWNWVVFPLPRQVVNVLPRLVFRAFRPASPPPSPLFWPFRMDELLDLLFVPSRLRRQPSPLRILCRPPPVPLPTRWEQQQRRESVGCSSANISLAGLTLSPSPSASSNPVGPLIGS